MSYQCQKTQKWLCLPRTGVPPSTRSRCPSWERWLMPVRNWDRTGCPTSTLTPSVSHRPAPVPLSHPHHQKKYPPGNWFVRRKRNLHPPTNQSVSRKKLKQGVCFSSGHTCLQFLNVILLSKYLYLSIVFFYFQCSNTWASKAYSVSGNQVTFPKLQSEPIPHTYRHVSTDALTLPYEYPW